MRVLSAFITADKLSATAFACASISSAEGPQATMNDAMTARTANFFNIGEYVW